MKQSAIIVLVCVALFLIGRFTAPQKPTDDRRAIDSLKAKIATHERREAILKDSLKRANIMSDTWYNLYDSATKIKSITHTIYDNRTKAIDRLTDADLDSAFRAVYPDK